ncbi:MAG TPA: substrate-binding domain-containing protein [Spirochaetota bacterium]|nr:substrate-binding domain-containing protein [Spirochaetota bacterium]
MPGELMNTKEVAEYLGIHEKQVYALIKDNRIPCTRVTGKWVFPKPMIDEWISTSARAGRETDRNERREMDAVFAAGSNDPVLDILMNSMRVPGFHIFSSSTGSTEGLDLLRRGNTDLAWCHLFDPETGSYNIPYIISSFEGMKIAVVHLFYRELGFVSSPSMEKPVKTFSDLDGASVRFVNRQKGSGTRLLIDYRLEREGISTSAVAGYTREVRTHMEVGLSILSGLADAGVATVAVSKLLGLPFEPLVRESFDMVLTQETFFKKGVRAFIDALGAKDFRRLVEPLGNYDFGESGKILYSAE